MDLTGTQIKNTYGNVLTIGTTAGSPQTGTLQNGEGLNITSATLTGGTVTTSNPLLDMTQTWNDAGVTFTSLKLNVTDTASGANSLLLDLQVGGSSRFKVNATGNLFESGGHLFISDAGGLVLTNSSGTKSFVTRSDFTFITSAAYFGWGNTTTFATDLALFRDAAHTLAQRYTTNAQTFNIYNTYTDGSNYERGFLKWNSNVLVIGTESLGTGTTRNLQLDVASGRELRIGGGSGSTIYFTPGNQQGFRMNGLADFYPSNNNTLKIGLSTNKVSEIHSTDIFLSPSSSLTPSANGDLVIESTDNTTLTFKYKGSDGVVRSGTVALS